MIYPKLSWFVVLFVNAGCEIIHFGPTVRPNFVRGEGSVISGKSPFDTYEFMMDENLILNRGPQSMDLGARG